MRLLPTSKSLINALSALELSKYFLGLHEEKFCLISKKRNQIQIEFIGEDVRLLGPWKEANINLVMGLSSDQVILRHLQLKLKSEREIRSALPFQVENILPYDAEELILLPTLVQKEEGTDVSLLATSMQAIQEHLSQDPDILSCVPMALFRYARYQFPHLSSFFLQTEGTIIAVVDHRLQGFQAIRPGDEERVLAHFRKKYPMIEETPITNGPHFPFAAAIGLALDGAIQDHCSSQFRQKANQSIRSERRRKKMFVHFFALCACFTLLVGIFGQLHLKNREKGALQTLGFSGKNKLRHEIQHLEQSLLKQSKNKTSASPLPQVSELLAWLSAHPKLSDCSIQRVRYELLRSPRLGTQIKTYSAKIEIELTSKNPASARAFHEELMRDRTIVDQKQEIKWNAEDGIYRTSFSIKPRSL